MRDISRPDRSNLHFAIAFWPQKPADMSIKFGLWQFCFFFGSSIASRWSDQSSAAQFSEIQSRSWDVLLLAITQSSYHRSEISWDCIRMSVRSEKRAKGDGETDKIDPALRNIQKTTYIRTGFLFVKQIQMNGIWNYSSCRLVTPQIAIYLLCGRTRKFWTHVLVGMSEAILCWVVTFFITGWVQVPWNPSTTVGICHLTASWAENGIQNRFLD